MKFRAEDNNIMSRTLFLELHEGKLKPEEHAFRFCTHVIEAVCYLHNEVEILHNDITVCNIVIDGDHIVLVDFGKATRFSQARMYCLTEAETQEYTRKYPPELIYGQRKQSVHSDIYAVGFVLYQIANHCKILSFATKKCLKLLAEKCRYLSFFPRDPEV